MTIKQMEERSGMTRANIRFYESEGLLNPARQENGYRDYSEEDLNILLRIQLLRTLELSLEEIRAVQQGKRKLADLLAERANCMEQEQQHLVRSEQVCRQMCDDQVCFDTLDARRYLKALNEPTANAPAPKAPPVQTWQRDFTPPVQAPVRRWMARGLDEALIGLVPLVLLCSILHMNPSKMTLFVTIGGMLLVWLVEPLLLHRFGTTPGKWLMGLSVTDLDGGRLTIAQARERTGSVMFWGYGLNLPIFGLVREGLSCKRCLDGDTLPWETESCLVLRDKRVWRIVAVICAGMLVVFMRYLAVNAAVLAPCREPLTVETFVKNYNHYLRYYDLNDTFLLNADGNRRLLPEEEKYVVVVGAPYQDIPEFEYEVDADGRLRRVTLSVRKESSSDGSFASVPIQQETLAAMSMLMSQRGINLLDVVTLEHAALSLSQTPLVERDRQMQGVHFTKSLTMTGYFEMMDGLLFPEEDAEQSFHYDFSVEFTGE